MTLSQIIRRNNIVELKSSLSNIDLDKLSSAGYTSIVSCRSECFDLIHEKSKQFKEDERYQSIYLANIFYAAAKYNKINILKSLVMEENFKLKEEEYRAVLGAANQHFRIIKFIAENFKLTNKHFFIFLRDLLSNASNRKKVSVKKINFLLDFVELDIKDFFLFLNVNGYIHYINFNKDLFSSKEEFTFSTFIEKYDKKNYLIKNIDELLPALNPRVREKYLAENKKYLLKDKIIKF
jgi:hypothetical protein